MLISLSERIGRILIIGKRAWVPRIIERGFIIVLKQAVEIIVLRNMIEGEVARKGTGIGMMEIWLLSWIHSALERLLPVRLAVVRAERLSSKQTSVLAANKTDFRLSL